MQDRISARAWLDGSCSGSLRWLYSDTGWGCQHLKAQLSWRSLWKSLSHVQLFATPWTSPWTSPGQNTRVGSLSLLQGIFPTQGLNPGLPHCRGILYQLSHNGSPRILEWVAYLFSRGSSRPRNRTGVSFIASGFFTTWAIREVPGGVLKWLAVNAACRQGAQLGLTLEHLQVALPCVGSSQHGGWALRVCPKRTHLERKHLQWKMQIFFWPSLWSHLASLMPHSICYKKVTKASSYAQG